MRTNTLRFFLSLIISCFFLVPLAFIFAFQDKEESAVRIEQGAIDIEVQFTQQQYLNTSFRVAYTLHNPSDKPDRFTRTFPVSAPLSALYNTKKPWCRILVDGKPVKYETQPVLKAATPFTGYRQFKNQDEWGDRLEALIQQDAELLGLVTKYRQLIRDPENLREISTTFESRVKNHLIYKSADNVSAAYHLARGDASLLDLIELMPEIDPKFRIDLPDTQRKYVSILAQSYSFAPYDKEWRAQADQWLASKPDLAELVPKLRQAWDMQREPEELLNGPLLKYVHDHMGLSLQLSKQFVGYIQADSYHPQPHLPSVSLMRTLFPDIDQEIKTEDIERSKKLAQWGFNESLVSPYTGKLIKYDTEPRRESNDFYSDPTVLDAIGRPQQAEFLSRRYRLNHNCQPVLISFAAPLQAKSHSKIVVEYDCHTDSFPNPWSSIQPNDITELSAVFPALQTVPVTVTCPATVQPIIAPAPQSVTKLENGGCRFETRLTNKATMLHFIAVNLSPNGNGYSLGNNPVDLADIETVLEKTINITVRPLLMTKLFSRLREKQAYQLVVKIQQEYPDFQSKLSRLLNSKPGRDAETDEWIEAKVKSPKIISDSDFERFRIIYNYRGIEARLELIKRLDQLDVAKLDVQEQMGRLFMLCTAGVDSKQNFATLLKLAESNPKRVNESLRFIRELQMDKSAALPFVLNQFDPDLPKKMRAKKLTAPAEVWQRRNQALRTLGSFRSPQTATRIIALIQSTDDSLSIQEAMEALSQMTLPKHFEELARISDHIAESSASDLIRYLELLVRSDDQKKAPPVLNRLRKQYPELAARITPFLAHYQPSEELARAQTVYQNTKAQEEDLQAAINVLFKYAEPTDIVKLAYRKGLPQRMNQRLVRAIAEKGGDESAYPFVEAYYLEFIQGQKADNDLTCVSAFEEIGDQRAIPYLREIVKKSERKEDAAHAIGNIIFDKRIKKKIDYHKLEKLDENIRTLFRDPAYITEKERTQALDVLLKDPGESIERMFQRGDLQSIIDSPDSQRYMMDRRVFSILNRFGDLPTLLILEKSDGCSLEKRYKIAEILAVLLPESRPLIEAAALDKTADIDRRATARLALKMYQDRLKLAH
ncbi:hypothetical protein [Gimesia chilikensis]|uniref:Uncharacterized protein n=1 Tax=Gimesia chilikensis TaxID=2605989 RepID=A0A517PQC8_9PLAN|nr:hypothetical protein [Gimesia chilikensis]QDT21572.1 hypothetical protein HG66A1_33750 [Gimesia chilikensis]